jgi:hypothetical protein
VQQGDRRAEAVAVARGGVDGGTSEADLVEAALDEIGGGDEKYEAKQDRDREG